MDASAAVTGVEPALAVRGLSKSFAGVAVLRDANLIVRPSTVHALVGHNGSGKSTLVKILAGFHVPDTQLMATAFGVPFTLGDHAAAAKAGLRFVHQDLGLIDQLSTVDNLALGPGYPLRRPGLIRWSEAVRRSDAAMSALGYDVDVTMPVGLLSAAERTGAAIARALQGWSGRPSVVVLDEPTAAMPAPEVRRLFAAVDRLRSQGLGIVYVSHHLDEILTLADDVTVLRNGEVVTCRAARGLTHDELVASIVGRDAAAMLTKTTTRPPVSTLRKSVLDVEGLHTAEVHGASFAVLAGEILGIAGIRGSGRDDVLPAIAGAVPRSGTVRIGAEIVPARRPRAAIKAGLGFVPANRRRAAVLPTFNSAANLTVSSLQRHVRHGLLNHRAERDDAASWFDRLEVSPPNTDAPILTLSGGNQQKVVVGRWLRCETTLLALDEPTQGVDIGARQAIYGSLRRATRAGNGVVISSSDADELAAVCDRVIVLAHGRIVAELAGPELEAHRIDEASLDIREVVAP